MPALTVERRAGLQGQENEIGRGSDPHWHQSTDLYVTFSDSDFRLGFNAIQTTLGTTATLVEARIVD